MPILDYLDHLNIDKIYIPPFHRRNMDFSVNNKFSGIFLNKYSAL